MSVRVLTVATHETPGLANLRTTAANCGVSLTVLGMGQPWEGFITKPKLFAAELKRVLDADALVFCIDSSDVLIQGTPEDMETGWKASVGDRAVLIGAELRTPERLYTNTATADLAPWRRCTPGKQYKKFNFNTGVVGGRVPDLLSLYEWCLAESERSGEFDDQVLAGMYANLFPDRVAMDVGRDMVHNYDPLLMKLTRLTWHYKPRTSCLQQAPFFHVFLVQTWPMSTHAYNTRARLLCGPSADLYNPTQSSHFGWTCAVGVLMVLMLLGLLLWVVLRRRPRR